MAGDGPERPQAITVLASICILFGALTLLSGGSTLFLDGAARAAAGNYVGFVLWFNFLAGFAYIAAGSGLLRWQKWGVQLSVLVAAATVLVFAAFGIHILFGGTFEPRTIGAMVLRSGVWLAVAMTAQAAWRRRETP